MEFKISERKLMKARELIRVVGGLEAMAEYAAELEMKLEDWNTYGILRYPPDETADE